MPLPEEIQGELTATVEERRGCGTNRKIVNEMFSLEIVLLFDFNSACEIFDILIPQTVL